MKTTVPLVGRRGARDADWSMTRMAALFYAVLSLGAVAWGVFMEHRWVWVMPADMPPRLPLFENHGAWVRNLAWAVLGGGAGILIAGLSRWASGRVRWLDDMEEGFCDLIGPIGWRQALAMATASAVGEEFVFRGIALPAVGLWWSSLIFAIVHLPMDRRFVLWPVFAGLVGLVLGALVLGAGNLGPALCLHFSVNFFNLLSLGRKAAGRAPFVIEGLKQPASDRLGRDNGPSSMVGTDGPERSGEPGPGSAVSPQSGKGVSSDRDPQGRNLPRSNDSVEPTE